MLLLLYLYLGERINDDYRAWLENQETSADGHQDTLCPLWCLCWGLLLSTRGLTVGQRLPFSPQDVSKRFWVWLDLWFFPLGGAVLWFYLSRLTESPSQCSARPHHAVLLSRSFMCAELLRWPWLPLPWCFFNVCPSEWSACLMFHCMFVVQSRISSTIWSRWRQNIRTNEMLKWSLTVSAAKVRRLMLVCFTEQLLRISGSCSVQTLSSQDWRDIICEKWTCM